MVAFKFTIELRSEAGLNMLRYPSFRHKMIHFRSTSPIHQIVVTSSDGSQTAQKVSSRRVLTPYQKSFFFRRWMIYYFLVRNLRFFEIFDGFPSKSMKNKGKLSKTNVFPLFFIDFGKIHRKSEKNLRLRIKKIKIILSEKKLF